MFMAELFIIMLGALLGVPLAKWSMDLIFPYFISNVAIGMDLQSCKHDFCAQICSWLNCYLYLLTYLLSILQYFRRHQLVQSAHQQEVDHLG